MSRKSFFKVIKNRYFIVSVGFVAWMFFFDQNDWLYKHKVQNEIEKLKADLDFYQEKVDSLKVQKHALDHDPSTLEKYARESFYMAKPGEDLYIVVEPKK